MIAKLANGVIDIDILKTGILKTNFDLTQINSNPTSWNMEILTEILKYLRIQGILRIDPDWLPTPTYVVQRTGKQGQLIEDCGKGLSVINALYSALFESIERSAAENYQENCCLTGSFTTLKDQFPLCFPGIFVPDYKEIEDLELYWCRGKDLLTSKDIYVPADCVYFPFASRFFPVSTTGLAANQTMEQAILHAIYEVIEYDTLSIHCYTGLPGRDVILSPEFEPLYSIYSDILSNGLKVNLKYLDNDLHIPVVISLFEEIPQMPGIKVAGIGCHLDPFIAAQRALTECAQSASFWYKRYLRGEMEEGKIFHPPLFFDPAYIATCAPIGLEKIESKSFKDTTIDLKLVLEQLCDIASHVIFIDLTRPDFPIPSVKIVIPNFEDSFTGNLSRGRAVYIKKIIDEYINSAQEIP